MKNLTRDEMRARIQELKGVCAVLGRGSDIRAELVKELRTLQLLVVEGE